MQKRVVICVFTLALLCLSVGNVFGQLTATATLQGTVTDKTSAVIPGAEVQVSNKQTGLSRVDKTSNNGLYVFNLLPAGIYEVRIAVKGFSTAVFQSVELAVGRTTTIDAQLAPSQQAETITVEASGAALVDLQKTDVSVPITPSDVENLPLNGRDFVNLALLAPGARPVASYDPTKNRIGVFATNGSGGRNVNVTVNGIDNKDNTVGGPVMQLPLEAVQEFNISTQRFSAANGRSEGAAVNVITKSGTNDFHGSIFFQDRDQAFDTLNYFEQTAHGGTGQKAPFSRQQFGGSVGGPIKKDKTFIFFAIERSRENTSINELGLAYTNSQLITNLGAVPIQTIATPYFDWRYNGRIDHRINDKNTVNFSYSNQNNTGLNDQATSTSDGSQTNFTTNQLIIANATWNSVISPSLVNSFTAGYQYWNNLISSDKFVPTLQFPDLSVGTNPNVPQESYQRKWQFKDDMALTHGAHSFKFGFDYLWEPIVGGFFVNNPTATLTFFDDPSVILTNKTEYPQGFATPGAIQTVTQATTGDPYFVQHPKMFGLYFQDDWKVNRRLTLNLGLRWDKDYGLNGGVYENNARAFQELKAIGNPYGSHVPHDDNKDFSPRIGLAYDLTGAGKHVLRFGYGLYYGQTFQNITLFMEQQANPSLFSTATFTNNVTPGTTGGTSNALPSGELLQNFRYGVDPIPPQLPGGAQLPTGSTGRLVDPTYRNPYSEQFNGGYSFQVTSDSVIEAEYVHELGLHESKSIVINPQINGVRATSALFAAAGLPVLGEIQDYDSIGRSRYDAMNLSYRKRMTRNFSINASYVLSRALAYNGTGAGFGNGPTDELNWFAPHDFGPTPQDERHRITISGLINLPFKITFSPIMAWASGRPYSTLEGVNDTFGFGGGQGSTHTIVLNSDPNNLLATKAYSSGQLLACLAANTCHQVSYDNVRGADFFQLDARVGRFFRIKERAKLEVFFQAFDLTNHANFGTNYGTNIRSATFETPTAFLSGSGVITPKSFSGEFGARFSF
ncbi:MAG TPA: carboxypeptidase regulatory-like domain-containing protein [Bryobacteraceae bacterium]|nr:carboxypeptidase regulatory-like domain-containing protein [Bryobacteraceae bacterium]